MNVCCVSLVSKCNARARERERESLIVLAPLRAEKTRPIFAVNASSQARLVEDTIRSLLGREEMCPEATHPALVERDIREI